MVSKMEIDDFLNFKILALVGVSKEKMKFGNTLYNELIKRKYTVYPVHSEIEEIRGNKCYKTLADVPKDTQGVVIAASPANAMKALRAAKDAGYNNIWLQQTSDSKESAEFAEQNNMKVISRMCLLMFLQPASIIHKVHSGLLKLFGQYPK
jgi:predicted CoA-binding protein